MSPGDRRSPGDEEPTADGESPTMPDEQPATGGKTHPESGGSGRDGEASAPSESPDRSQRNLQTPDDGSADQSMGAWERFRTAEDGPLLLLREVLISGGIVLLFGLLLFGVSGVWPPMVAVESESMEPNINQYDLIVVTEPGRFASGMADRTGVVTANSVSNGEHESFNRAGSVVVYDNPASSGPPIIHRAHFFVEEGENWYDEANPEYISADSCAELDYCPAPYAGYITKGDNEISNSQYDQANDIAPVVRPEWVSGIAQIRLPYVGYIRLALTGAASFGPVVPAGVGAIGAGTAYGIGRRSQIGRRQT